MVFTACNSSDKEKNNKTEISKNNSEDEGEDEPIKPKKKKITREEANSDAQILNNIVVHEQGGLEIARAFLAFESGELVSSKNNVHVGDPVYLNLLIKKGWVTEGRKVSLGASEKIETDAGEVVLDAPDLFKNTPSLDESDANSIQLKARITRTSPDINYFVIYYRVWDKNGDGKVSGSYKLYVDDSKQ